MDRQGRGLILHQILTLGSRLILAGIAFVAAASLITNVDVFMHLFYEPHEAFAVAEDVPLWMWIADTVLWIAMLVSTVWLMQHRT